MLSDFPQPKKIDSFYKSLSERAEEGVRGSIGDWHYYWKDGYRIDSPAKNFTLKTNLSIMVDGGYIGAEDELKRAFPVLEGANVEFRQLRVSIFGTLYDWAEFKVDIDLNSEAIRGGKEFDFTAGLNWYLNKKTRFMFNYIRAKVEDRETQPAVEEGSADIFQARFQIEF